MTRSVVAQPDATFRPKCPADKSTFQL